MNPKFRLASQYLGVTSRLSAAALLTHVTYAGDIWIGGAAGDTQNWNNATNWGGAFPTGNAQINIGTGNFPIISADSAFTPIDIFVGTAGNTGRLDHRAGVAATGNNNWMFVGQGNLGNGTYNLADTSASGGSLTGFGPGSGSLNVGGPTTTTGGRLIVGDGGTSTGVFNMNTSGTLKMEENGIGLILGNGGTSTGTFRLDGGTVQSNSTSNTGIAILAGTNGADANFLMSGGTVNVTGGVWAGDNNAGTQGLIDITGGTFTGSANGTGTQAGQNYIGRGLGQGTFNVSGTADVSLTGSTHIGYSTTATAGTAGTLAVSGGTFLNTGELRIGSSAGNTVAAASSGTFNVSGGTATVTANLVFGRGNDAGDLTTGQGTVSGTGTLNVGGDLVLAYAGSNNLGQLTVNGGTVNVATTAEKWLIVNQWDTARGQLTVDSGNLNLNANSDVRFSRNGSTGASSVTLNGGAITSYSGNGTGSATSGLVDLNLAGGAAADNTFHLNGGTLTISAITSTVTTGTRTFNFNGGTLKASNTSANFLNLGTGTGVARANVRDNGAIIDSNGFDITIPQPLELSNVSGDLLTGGLTKLGAGKLTLSGANTYTGATNVNAGTLNIDGTLASNVVVAIGGTLTGIGSTTGSLTFNSGSTLLTSTTAPLVANGVTFSGPTTLVFDGIPDNGNQYVLFQYGAGGVTGLSNLSSTFRTVISNDTANSQVLGTVTTGSITWNTTNGTWVNGGGGWTGGFTSYFNGDTVTFPERTGPSTVTLSGVLLPASVTVSNTSDPYTFTGSGSIGGATGLTKDGAGALTIATANSYTGGTTLNAGTLNINNASALGTGVLFINGGTLDNTSGLPIVMTGNIQQSWEADVVFTGSSSLDMGTGAVSVGGAGNRTVTVSANTLAVGEITGGFEGLTKQGAGTLEVASTGANVAASVISGTLNVAAGTLQINRTGTNAEASGDFTAAGIIGTGTITNGAAVERWFFTNPSSGSFTFPGILANGGAGNLGFNKSGAGTQTISGANTYTGQTTVEGGELVISGTNSGAGTNAQINSGKLTLAATQALGTTSLIRLAGADVSTLELATNTDGTAYPIFMPSGTSAAIVSNRATSGAGINHTLTTQTGANGLGGGTLNITSGANVTSGTGRVTFTQFGLGAGTVQTTTLNPTTANVTLVDVSKQNNNVSQTLGLGGTSTDNQVTGVISNGAVLTGANTISVLKSGSSTWTLSGANTYTGTTTVTGGILTITQAVLADAASVTVNTGGTLNLTFAGTDTVDRVFLDGVEQAAGTWGSLSSSATHKTALITGTGILLATNGAPVGGYNSWATSFGLDPLTDGAAGVDKELDGFANGTEYILGGSPVSGSNNPKIYSLAADSSADGDTTKELVLTIAVPQGTPAFSAGAPTSTATFEGYGIQVRGSTDLVSFPVTVTPVDPVVTGLPTAPFVQGGITYEYRSFSLNGSNGTTAKGFLQVVVTNP